MYFQDPESFKSFSGYEIDGIWYPRVTKIVDIKAKPALYRYYAEALDYQSAQATTQKSAQEGTLIHEAVEKILIGEKPEIDPSISPALQAFTLFLSEKNIQADPNYVEKRLISYDHRYAGTMDALALIDGKLGILDIKTSQAIYRDYNLQTSAYMEPLSKEIKNLQTRWIMRIDQQKVCLKCGATLRQKGGREKIKLPRPDFTSGRGSPQNSGAANGAQSCPESEHQWSELRGIVELKESPYWKEDFEAFLGAKKLWEWENDYWLRQIGYLG